VIGYPPVLEGAGQDRFTWVADVAVAVNEGGAVGALDEDAGFGFAVASEDGFSLVPNEVIA
jgi:hypothetical protein